MSPIIRILELGNRMLKLLECKDPVCPDFSMVSLTRNLGKLNERFV